VVDVSPWESVPQLFDVLVALTESQQRLLAKVRALRDENGSHEVEIASPQPNVVSDPERQMPGPETAERAYEAHRTLPLDAPLKIPDPTRTAVVEVQLETTTLSSQATMESAGASSEGGSKDRNYNFFDELDAKLARMDDAGGVES
jgi:hypothetical protein